MTHLRDAAWLKDGALARLLAVLNADGEEARVVGGTVRNALLGAPLGDIDIATTAVPDEVMKRAHAAGFKPVPTGIDHGTITVVIDGRPFEVTTLREDVETFGRHANVAFGRDWKVDAERRDFTMNALSVTADGTLYDYVGGLADLEARRVRFIGDAAQRIEEDYLRILRFFRFHAAYGHGAPDAAGLHACIVARAGLAQLSRERVRMEMIKLLDAPGAAETLRVMAEVGLLETVLGGVPLNASFERMVEIERALALPADATRRLGALALFVREDAERLWTRLRLSNVEHKRLDSMADSYWRLSAQTSEQDARVLLYHLGPERYADRVMLAWSREGKPNGADRSETWRALATLPQRWSAPAFPLKAADFIARGVPKGPHLGEALAAAEELWIAAGFSSERDVLEEIVSGVIDLA